MSKTNQYPDAHVDCVITNKDGAKRIGRYNHRHKHWEYMSYFDRKTHVVWPDEDVIKWEVITAMQEEI